MFKNLILPIDGSALSALAIPLAIRLAHAFRAKLHIVRVHVSTPDTPDQSAAVSLDETLRDIEREKLDAIVQTSASASVSTTAELLEGPVVPALERYVKAVGVDLVIMATHGRSGIKRAVLGSVAERFVHKSAAPVLLLHAKSDHDAVRTDLADLKRVLVALDGSPESEAILPYANALARLCSAELVLMQTAAPIFEAASVLVPEVLYGEEVTDAGRADEYLQWVAKRQSASLRVRTTVKRAASVTEGILQCAREESADLIAMSTHGRDGWSRVALGSVAESVMRHTDIPVLMLRTPAG